MNSSCQMRMWETSFEDPDSLESPSSASLNARVWFTLPYTNLSSPSPMSDNFLFEWLCRLEGFPFFFVAGREINLNFFQLHRGRDLAETCIRGVGLPFLATGVEMTTCSLSFINQMYHENRQCGSERHSYGSHFFWVFSFKRHLPPQHPPGLQADGKLSLRFLGWQGGFCWFVFTPTEEAAAPGPGLMTDFRALGWSSMTYQVPGPRCVWGRNLRPKLHLDPLPVPLLQLCGVAPASAAVSWPVTGCHLLLALKTCFSLQLSYIF